MQSTQAYVGGLTAPTPGANVAVKMTDLDHIEHGAGSIFGEIRDVEARLSKLRYRLTGQQDPHAGDEAQDEAASLLGRISRTQGEAREALNRISGLLTDLEGAL